ncbi:MAG: hypothetical protein AAFW47_00860 [Pseudomonadota bacterium]
MIMTKKTILPALAAGALIAFSSFHGVAQNTSDGSNNAEVKPKTLEPKPEPSLKISREGSMTLIAMRDILKRLDQNLIEPRAGTFRLLVEDFEVGVFTSVPANRMRVMVRVRSSENLTKDDLMRISQANLDSALDARYAVGRGVLWATYIHPLSSLHQNQFIEAIGSTVNLAANYGTTYSSGQVVFGGGDSRGILGRQLIDKLIKKGQPI